MTGKPKGGVFNVKKEMAGVMSGNTGEYEASSALLKVPIKKGNPVLPSYHTLTVIRIVIIVKQFVEQ